MIQSLAYVTKGHNLTLKNVVGHVKAKDGILFVEFDGALNSESFGRVFGNVSFKVLDKQIHDGIVYGTRFQILGWAL